MKQQNCGICEKPCGPRVEGAKVYHRKCLYKALADARAKVPCWDRKGK